MPKDTLEERRTEEQDETLFDDLIEFARDLLRRQHTRDEVRAIMIPAEYITQPQSDPSQSQPLNPPNPVNPHQPTPSSPSLSNTLTPNAYENPHSLPFSGQNIYNQNTYDHSHMAYPQTPYCDASLTVVPYMGTGQLFTPDPFPNTSWTLEQMDPGHTQVANTAAVSFQNPEAYFQEPCE